MTATSRLAFEEWVRSEGHTVVLTWMETPVPMYTCAETRGWFAAWRAGERHTVQALKPYLTKRGPS